MFSFVLMKIPTKAFKGKFQNALNKNRHVEGWEVYFCKRCGPFRWNLIITYNCFVPLLVFSWYRISRAKDFIYPRIVHKANLGARL